FLFLEAAAGGTIALFWVHLRNEVGRGFTLFTGAAFLIIGALAIWLRATFPPSAALALSATARLWFSVERWTTIAFILLLAVYLTALYVVPRRRRGRDQAKIGRNGVATRPTHSDSGPRPAELWRPLAVIGPLVPLMALCAVWSAALVDASAQLFGLGTPLAVLAGALALGSALTGLSLGHWYLVSPTLSIQPLVRVNFLCLGAIVAQLFLLPILMFGPGTAADALHSLLTDYLLFLGVRVIFGLLVPLGATVMTWRTARIRSLDSATGLLYIVAALVLAGEIAARALFFLTGVAT
ncbi:MAG: hypothetical protein JOY61_15645, partial [Chloroflexi bacterium]|nr:hypothetical protein [Chloroflexota bacterium]